MKKQFFKAILVAALAAITAFSSSAFELEQVESAAEKETLTEISALAEETEQTDYAIDANGGSVEIEFVYNEAIDPAQPEVDLGKSSAACNGPRQDDDGNWYVTITGTGYAGVVTVTYGEEIKTVHLYGGKLSKPGLNIYTGTTEPMNIGDLNGTALIKDGKLALSNVDAMPIVEKDGKTGVDAKKNEKNNYHILKNTDFEIERHLEFSVDYLGKVQLLYLYDSSEWVSYSQIAGVWNQGAKEIDTWTHFNNKTTTRKGQCSACANNNKNKGEHNNFSVGGAREYNGVAFDYELYLNNLNMTPYYKATYMNSDGTVLGTDYFLYDANGNILTSYTPSFSATPVIPDELNGKIVSLSGWTTEQGGKEAMSLIELDNEDIVLYPVFGEFAFDPMDASATTAKTYSLETFAKANITIASADFDCGYTDAAVAFDQNANTITVTAKGYAGVISVTLTDTDGNTYPYAIRLFGGKLSKPGLNIYTGTTEPMNIGDLGGLISANKLTLTNMSKMAVAEKDGKLGTYVLESRTQLIKKTGFELERPIGISLDYIGNAKYLMILDSNNWKQYYTIFGDNGTVRQITKWTTASNKANGGICAICKNKSENFGVNGAGNHDTFYVGSNVATDVYFNNLNFTPYYKITYVNGETSTDVYALYDDNGALLTAYTPDAETLGAKYYTLSADSDVYYSVSTPIALNHEDITIYAYTPDETQTIVNTMETSIRAATTEHSAGIRFKSFVSEATMNAASEFGYIVAREDQLLAKGTAEDLMIDTVTASNKNDFTGKTANGVKYIGAYNYNAEKDIQIYTPNTDGTVTFNGVTVGLNGEATIGGIKYANRYAVRFTTRPYVKIGDTYYYGACKTSSLAETAQKLIDNGKAGDNLEAYEKIIAEAGKKA